MHILVAFERSGVVRDAFIAAGHDAISCDLEPTERPGPHIQGDARPLLLQPWDMVIAHVLPELCSKMRPEHEAAPPIADEVGAAIDIFVECWAAPTLPASPWKTPCPFKFVSRFLGPPQSKVDPYISGDNYRKRTWFWTRGLPPLLPIMSSLTPAYWVGGTIRKAPVHVGLGVRNHNLRARFFPGMAAAMAQQWGTQIR